MYSTKRYLKKISFVFAFVFLSTGLAGLQAQAKSDGMIYQSRLNSVKLENLPRSVVEEVAPNHPYTAITTEQMRAILLSLRISKNHLIKKEAGQRQIFSEDEADKYAGYLVEAFSRVSPEEWVVMSIIQKRPFFILRNDLMTSMRLWVEGSHLHVRFDKIYAKMIGDYESNNQQEKRVRQQVQGVNFMLEAGDGQMLSADSVREVEIDLSFDFVSWWKNIPRSAEGEPLFDQASVAKYGQSSGSKSSVTSTPEKTTKARLEELEALKKEGLVTPEEYQSIRKSILGNL